MHPYDQSYLDEVIETQGRLFDRVTEFSPGIDVAAFIRDYLCSRTRAAIDKGQAYVSTMDEESLWRYYMKADRPSIPAGDPMPGFLPDWIGRFYACYQWEYNVPSKDLERLVPLDFLIRAYPGLHDLDLDLAVKKAKSRNFAAV